MCTRACIFAILKATCWLEPIARAEHDALLRVAQRLLEAALGRTGGERGEGDASLVERLQEVGVPAPALAEQVGLGTRTSVSVQRMGVGGVPADLVVAAARR